MATMRRPKGGTIWDYLGFAMVAIFCGWPMGLGAWVSIDSAQTTAWLPVAINVGFAAMGAASSLAVVHSVMNRHFAKAALALPVFLVCLAIGLVAALTNQSTGSDHLRETIRGKMVSAAAISSQKVSLQGKKDAQVEIITKPFKSPMLKDEEIPGEASANVIEAKANAFKMDHARLWRITGRCDPDQLTSKDRRDFCSGLEELKGKKGAADARDTFQMDLNAQPKSNGEAPSTIDSFDDLMAWLLAKLGYKEFEIKGEDREQAKLEIAHAKDSGRAVGLVMMEQMGPSILWIVWSMLFGGHRKVEKVQPKREKKAAVLDPVPGMTVAPPAVCIHKSFAERRLERCDGAKKIPSGVMYKLWCEDCAQQSGVDPGSPQLFGRRLKKYVDHDPGSHPGYLNVRIKAEHAHARPRLVVNG